MSNLLLPVGPRLMSTWSAHQRRTTPSSEPGTDWYCPIGTPVLAPADGRIYGYGTSIRPATGRWVGIDFDNGMRFRALHLSRLVRTGGRVRRGEVIGYSGASGYGKEDWSGDRATGGAHVHGTLWPTHRTRFGYDSRGRPYTIDFMQYADLSAPASGATSTNTPDQKEEIMIPAILEIKGDSQAGKSLYDLRTGRAIRAISRDENSSFRIAEARGAAVYVSVSRDEYKQRGGK